MPATKRPIQTRFRYACAAQRLKLATGNNSQTHYTKGRPSPHKAAPTDLLAIGFSYYFTPLTGVLFTFPSRYWFTVGHHRVFSLTPWSARIHTGFHVSGATQDTTRLDRVLNYGTITRFGHSFQNVRLTVTSHIVVLQPQQDKSRWFGLLRVRSPLLTESILFLFLRLLRCFTSPRITLPALCIQAGVIPHYRDWVAPFGDLRIKACVPLPEAFRSLLRPSSSDDAKAFTNGCNWFMQTLVF